MFENIFQYRAVFGMCACVCGRVCLSISFVYGSHQSRFWVLLLCSVFDICEVSPGGYLPYAISILSVGIFFAGYAPFSEHIFRSSVLVSSLNYWRFAIISETVKNRKVVQFYSLSNKLANQPTNNSAVCYFFKFRATQEKYFFFLAFTICRNS